MPTQQMGAESRAPTTLPDIFRTINGINLDIGPLDRIRGGQGQDGSNPGGRDDAKNGAPGSCPRIVLRDALGHELDTFTALQEAIYRAKSNVKQTGQAKTPLEWRLPKAPPPARPDLTRTFPPVKHPSVPTVAEKTRSKWSHSRVMEFDVEDVGFVQESLQHLPHVPSLSFLRQEILVGPKTYFQIVGTMLLHEKVLSQTEKRQAIYNFPGFCSGCIRMGLCYGCEKGSEPHFHEDKPVRTGGGFTYFKKDRPENEMKGRNPINWKIHHPDLVLKKLMEDYAGVDLDGQIPAEIQEHLDKYGGHRVRQMPHIPDFASEMEEQRQREKREADLEILKQNGGLLPRIHADGTMGEDSNNMTSRAEGRNAGQMSNRGPGGQLVNPDDVNIEMPDDRTYGTSGDPDERSDSRRQQKVIGGSESGQQDTVMVPTSQSTKRNKSRSGATDGTSQLDKSDDESRRSRSYDTYRHRLPKYRKTQSDDERNEEEEEESDEEGGSVDRKRRRGRRREKLYQAPPAFKLKKSPSRRTQAKSPFSTERSFSINKGKAFQVKKSDKALTEFKDFRNVDATWKEPKKFELKKTGNKSTKFWSGPPKSKKEEKITGNKKMKFRRVPSPRAISPDSGLDSEFMTAIVRRKSPSSVERGDNRQLYTKLPPLSENGNLVTNPSNAPSNQLALDGYNDTAAEYYKNIVASDDVYKQNQRTGKRKPKGQRKFSLSREQSKAHLKLSNISKHKKIQKDFRQSGLTSQPSLRHSPFMSPVPGSQWERGLSKDSIIETEVSKQPESERKLQSIIMSVYKPQSSAISPILYERDNSGSDYSGDSDVDENWKKTAEEVKKFYMGEIQDGMSGKSQGQGKSGLDGNQTKQAQLRKLELKRTTSLRNLSRRDKQQRNAGKSADNRLNKSESDKSDAKLLQLKIPTGRRESLLSWDQSQFTGSHVDHDLIAGHVSELSYSVLHHVDNEDNKVEDKWRNMSQSDALIEKDDDFDEVNRGKRRHRKRNNKREHAEDIDEIKTASKGYRVNLMSTDGDDDTDDSTDNDENYYEIDNDNEKLPSRGKNRQNKMDGGRGFEESMSRRDKAFRGKIYQYESGTDIDDPNADLNHSEKEVRHQNRSKHRRRQTKNVDAADDSEERYRINKQDRMESKLHKKNESGEQEVPFKERNDRKHKGEILSDDDVLYNDNYRMSTEGRKKDSRERHRKRGNRRYQNFQNDVAGDEDLYQPTERHRKKDLQRNRENEGEEEEFNYSKEERKNREVNGVEEDEDMMQATESNRRKECQGKRERIDDIERTEYSVYDGKRQNRREDRGKGLEGDEDITHSTERYGRNQDRRKREKSDDIEKTEDSVYGDERQRRRKDRRERDTIDMDGDEDITHTTEPYRRKEPCRQKEKSEDIEKKEDSVYDDKRQRRKKDRRERDTMDMDGDEDMTHSSGQYRRKKHRRNREQSDGIEKTEDSVYDDKRHRRRKNRTEKNTMNVDGDENITHSAERYKRKEHRRNREKSNDIEKTEDSIYDDKRHKRRKERTEKDTLDVDGDEDFTHSTEQYKRKERRRNREKSNDNEKTADSIYDDKRHRRRKERTEKDTLDVDGDENITHSTEQYKKKENRRNREKSDYSEKTMDSVYDDKRQRRRRNRRERDTIDVDGDVDITHSTERYRRKDKRGKPDNIKVDDGASYADERHKNREERLKKGAYEMEEDNWRHQKRKHRRYRNTNNDVTGEGKKDNVRHRIIEQDRNEMTVNDMKEDKDSSSTERELSHDLDDGKGDIPYLKYDESSRRRKHRGYRDKSNDKSDTGEHRGKRNKSNDDMIKHRQIKEKKSDIDREEDITHSYERHINEEPSRKNERRNKVDDYEWEFSSSKERNRNKNVSSIKDKLNIDDDEEMINIYVKHNNENRREMKQCGNRYETESSEEETARYITEDDSFESDTSAGDREDSDSDITDVSRGNSLEHCNNYRIPSKLSSLDKDVLSPPLVPNDIYNEKTSLTSYEPELIDIVNLDIANNREDEKNKREERKRRIHKYKRRKRREERKREHQLKETYVDEYSEGEGYDIQECVAKYDPEKLADTLERKHEKAQMNKNDEEIFHKAVELLRSGSNLSLDAKFENTSRKETKYLIDEMEMEDDYDNSEESVSDNGLDFDQFSHSTRRKSMKPTRKLRSNDSKRGKYHKEASSVTSHGGKGDSKQRASKNEKRMRSKEKKKSNNLSMKKTTSHGCNTNELEEVENAIKSNNNKGKSDEIDFKKLPSIENQLSKILKIDPKDLVKGKLGVQAIQKVKDDNVSALENGDDSDKEKELSYEIIDFENLEPEEKWEIVRPKSVEIQNIGLSGMNRNTFRSMSMPHLRDINIMLENMDESVLERLKEPLKVPVYLPGFLCRKPIKKQFKPNPRRVQGRQKRSMSVSMVTNIFPQLIQDSNKSELEPLREETWTPSPEPPKMTTPAPPRLPTPEKPRSISPLKRKEIVRKEKKEVKPRTPPPPKPPTPVIQERSPSPETSVEEVPVSREISFDFVKEPSLPELPPIEVPELPSIVEKESDYKSIKKERKLIEVAPEIPEQKKKLPGPPKLAPRIRSRVQSRKTKVAEAPVTTQELQQLADPLDFLAKYCIINPDRLPYYERVYNGAISVQTPRYSRDPSPPRGGAMVQLPPAQLSKHEIQMLHDLTVLNRSQVPRREGISAPEQYLEKLNHSLDFIRMKQDTLQDTMHRLQVEKMRYMAGQAKLLDRDIVRLDYKTKGKKKKEDEEPQKENSSKKKKKKKKAENIDYDMMGAMTVDMRNFKPSKAADITDEVIVSRMDDKMMKKVKKDPIVKQYNLELNRLVEKLKHFDERTAQIEDEKDLVGLYCMDYYFSEQVNASRPHEFRRQQSRLYQKLHPDQDVEMNIDEVETALQQINNKLLTEKEFQYIYFILDLPKREKINFRLFSIIAALSEKVTQMDPVIRKLLNKVDYNALDIKMEKTKELFELLQDEVNLPMGNAPTSTLALELTAGGLTPEHTSYVLSKFNREGKGFIDFLDFVTYVPLFIDIHKRIIADPFNESLDI